MAMVEAGAPTLAVSGLQAWYGESHILHGVDFEVRPGEVVTLLGRNGAGKTTTLKSIMGVVGQAPRLGRIRGTRDDRPVFRSHRPPRHGVLPRGARDLRQPQRPRKPDASAAHRRDRRADARAHLRPVPQSRRAAQQRRRQAVGRRAADAGDRPHPAHRRALPDARRADRGPGAGHHPPDRPSRSPSSSARDSPSCWSSRISVSPRRSPTDTT